VDSAGEHGSKRLNRKDFLRITGGGLAGAALLGTMGCGRSVGDGGGGGGEQPSAEYLVPAKEGPYLVGLANSFVGNSWRVQTLAEAEYAAQQRQDQVKDLLITNADNDVGRMNSQISDLVSQGVDILLVDAASGTAHNGVLRRAYQQGVLVVSYDSVVSSPHAMRVTPDNRKFGTVGAKWLVQAMGGEGKVFALNGVAGTPVNAQRWGAARSVLENAGIEIVGQADAAWDQAQGRAAAADLLAANPDVTGIYSQGGAMSLAALQVLEERDMDLIPIPGEGYNGFLKKWQELSQDGRWSSIAPSYPTWIGATALDIALRAIQGEDVGQEPFVELPVIEQDELGQFVRPDLPDSMWQPTKLPNEELNKLYKE
jgi:ribose transport system substrate-binding protein